MLLKTGLGRVFITLGPDGAFAAAEGEEHYLPSLAPRMKNATGAGRRLYRRHRLGLDARHGSEGELSYRQRRRGYRRRGGGNGESRAL